MSGIAGAIGLIIIASVFLPYTGHTKWEPFGIALFMGVGVPLGMGVLSGLLPSYHSRNPTRSFYFGIISGIFAIIIMIIIFTYLKNITFKNWITLGWITPTGKPINIKGINEYIVLGLGHLIPSSIVVIIAASYAEVSAAEPYCEYCNKRCKKINIGYLDGKITKNKFEDIISNESFDHIILPENEDFKQEHSEFSQFLLYACSYCDKTGFLNIIYHWFERNSDGSFNEKEEKIFSLHEMKEKQIKKLKIAIYRKEE